MHFIEPGMHGTATFEELLALARDAIHHAFDRTSRAPASASPSLRGPGASFVTLKQRGNLRGCIGTLVAHRALGDDVVANAVAAAFRDPRFPPLVAAEIPVTQLEISILSPPEPFPFADEEQFYAALRSGVDGLIVEYRGRRATFLPSVWEQLPDPHRFVFELRRKAGIGDDVQLPDLTVQRYVASHTPARPLARD